MLAHFSAHAPAFHAALLAATTKTTKSSGLSILPFLLLILVAGYFLWMRPKQRARLQQQQQQQQRPLELGDEVATTSGIVGVVHGVDDDRVRLEIAQGMVISVLRSAIGRSLGRPSDSRCDTQPSDGITAALHPGGLREEDEHWDAHDLTGADEDGERGDSTGADEDGERAPGWSLTSDDAAEPDAAVPAGRARTRGRRAGGEAAAGGRP